MARGLAPGEGSRGAVTTRWDLEGFLTGCPLGTGRTLLFEFFNVREIPPLNFNSSVSGLNPSISTLPSSKLSPILSHAPLLVPRLKRLKCHSSRNLKIPLSSIFGLIDLGAGGGGAGRIIGGGLGCLEPGRSNGLIFCPCELE